jgi:hypothetical protein
MLSHLAAVTVIAEIGRHARMASCLTCINRNASAPSLAVFSAIPCPQPHLYSVLDQECSHCFFNQIPISHSKSDSHP